jgi:phage terminase small subunit
MSLKRKQPEFVREYMVDFNATQAAIRAGYSEKTAYSIGQENLNKPEIKAAIDEAMEARAARSSLTVDLVVQGLLTEARNAKHEATRVAAWSHLAKHLGMFIDRVESTGTMNVISGEPLSVDEWARKHNVKNNPYE